MEMIRGLRSSLHRAGVLATLGSLLVLAGGSFGCGLLRPPPSEADLRGRFRDHRAELDRLAALALADSLLVGAGHDPLLLRFAVFVRDTSPYDRRLSDAEVQATGRAEIRRLLDRAGLRSISRSAEGDAVWFVAGSAGGMRHGIVYSERALEPTLTSLDGSPSGYIALAPKWYLFVMSSD